MADGLQSEVPSSSFLRALTICGSDWLTPRR
nr:MAG TPA: hypothetical protein [Caudoviricetes sp.]